MGLTFILSPSHSVVYTESPIVHFQVFTVPRVLVTQLCPPLSDIMDCSPPGSPVHGILQARILECVAIPFSKGSSQARDWTWVSCIAGRFFIVGATREAPICLLDVSLLVLQTKVLISQMLWLFIVSGKPWALHSSDHCSDSWAGYSVSSFGQDPQAYVYLSSSFFSSNYVYLTTQNHKLFY